MSKRGADRELNKDRDSYSDDEEQGGTWKAASKEEVAARVKVAVKRTPSAAAAAAAAAASAAASTAAPMPSFNFGLPATTSSSSSTSTDSSAAAPTAPATSSSAEEKKEEAAAAAAAPAGDWLAKFRPAPGSWNCSVCEVDNKAEDDKCKACETPNPKKGTNDTKKEEEKKEDKPAFTFGATANTASTTATTTTTTTTAAPTFSFGSSTTPNFTFGGATMSSTAPTFAFGATDSASTSVGFSFGTTSSFSWGTGSSSTSSGGFNFGTFGSAKPKKDGEEEEGEEGEEGENGENGENGGLKFEESSSEQLASTSQVNELFKDKKAEASGEENDTILHKTQTKVFCVKNVDKKAEDGSVVGSETKYVEMGSGELHINTFELDGKKKARMVLRAEKTQRLVLNAAINGKIINVSQPSEKHVRFHSFDLEGKLATFLLKFPGKIESSDVIKNINKAIEFTNA